MPLHVIDRGFKYFKEGRVADLEFEGRTIVGRVRGNEDYDVKLDIDWVYIQSGCSCPYPELCKHMAALLFEAYSVYGQVGGFFARIKADLNAKQEGRPVRHFAPRERLERDNRTSKSLMALPDVHGSFASWLAYLNNQFDNGSNEAAARVLNMEVRMNKVLNATPHWDASSKRAFNVLAYFCALNEVSSLFSLIKEDRYNTYMLRQSERRIVDGLKRMMVEMGEEFAKEMSEQWWIELNEFLRSIVIKHDEMGFSLVYSWILVFDQWVSQNVSLQDEISHWVSVKRQLSGAVSGQFRDVQSILSHLYLLTQQDHEALSILEESGPGMDFGIYLFNVDLLANNELWDRVFRWLEAKLAWVHEEAESLQKGQVYALCQRWIQLAQNDSEAVSDCESLLKRLRPVSDPYFARFFLFTGQYRTCVEYYLQRGDLPNEIDKDLLKHIEHDGPEYLLPLYHQGVAYYVGMKNRDAYKVAVRFLKKLSTIYKKSKRQGEWEQFLAEFTARHTRLRALQEEMRKRGLVG